MIIDCDKYRLNVKDISMMLNDKTPAERLDAIGSVAVSTGVPIIVVCFYVGELYGFSSQLYAKIDRLKAFYCITGVLGVSNES